ncbi:nucleoside hydrolase [Ktedonosporobacter rubrisoli]|uniref:Nucleoside hydrolase n=1 Tax=Ktedonosporobacter rubrisoli TaxID=2509675 RepID=A0A4P6JPK0_KTERU|nr:nucleoside hydrolase [Ktedonosporobacter rubrisoli]QBD76696.1 nucleoside hydrolase [Ktedonosporobacter rubrisoli]
MRRFLIDTDTASDDAVALVMAMQAPDVQVEAITVVAGNVPVEQGVQNALYTVELCKKRVPVYQGMAAPILRQLETAQNVHGHDGMGDIGLPLSGRVPAPGHAVDILRETIRRHPHEITLVTLGPLTNVGLALLLDPALARLVKECVIMGGIGQGYGNVTPVAEFNIWVDPEAAKIVFSSGMPITMVGWDISRIWATFDTEEAAAIRRIGTPLAEFCIDIQKSVQTYAIENSHLVGFDLPDPIAMAVALDRASIAESKRLFVEIDAESALSRGQTIVDHLGATGNTPNVEVVLAASRERFLEQLRAAVGA